MNMNFRRKVVKVLACLSPLDRGSGTVHSVDFLLAISVALTTKNVPDRKGGGETESEKWGRLPLLLTGETHTIPYFFTGRNYTQRNYTI